jgi:hypothetical protein
VKVPKPLAEESSGFFVALLKVKSYKPTFGPIDADRFCSKKLRLDQGLVAQLVRAHA